MIAPYFIALNSWLLCLALSFFMFSPFFLSVPRLGGLRQKIYPKRLLDSNVVHSFSAAPGMS